MTTFLRKVLALHRSEQIVLGALAVVVGVSASIGAILFRYAIQGIQRVAFGDGALADVAAALPAWQIVAVPALGGLTIGFLCTRVLPMPQPQGVAQVIEASALHGGRLRGRAGAGAALVNALAIGVGGSVGREGPIVHLGATLASALARRLSLPARSTRTLLGCGVAAAVAAAFNAPIAGVFFALEVVVGHYALTAFSPVVIASVVGTIIARLHYGNVIGFDLPAHDVISFLEVPAFVILGLVCGAAAIALLKTIALVDALHERLDVPPLLRPALAGLAVGGIAVAFPEVLGIGYETTARALHDGFALHVLVALALAKGLATALCLGSRFGGGIFSPALVIGALVGVSFDKVAELAFPAFSSVGLVYGVLGMGAVAGAVLGAPISTILIIFELTQDYELAFALMVSVSVATLFTMQAHGHSFFTWQLARSGINIRRSLELNLLERRSVAELLRTEHHAVPIDAPLQELKERFLSSHVPIYVCDDAGHLIGEVKVEDLADAAFAAGDAPAVTAGDLARSPELVLHADDDLEAAWRRSRVHDEEHIPVVKSAADPMVVGEVRQRDLALAHHSALIEARARERGEA